MADKASFTVRLIDKVSGPGKKAERSLGSVNRAIGRLKRDSRTSQKALGRFTAATDDLHDANNRLARGTSKPGSVFGRGPLLSSGTLDVLKGNLLTMAASKVLNLGAAAASAAGEFITFGQNSRLAFRQLAKHGADPEQLFDHSRELAKRFGLDLKDTTKQYQKFLALQFNPKQADKLIKMGADLQALGNSAEDVKGVFLSLGQIKGKGRLQGEEMLQLAERGISTVLIQEEIGKIMGGKSVQDVQKLQQAGKISAEVGLEAIERAINRKLGQSELGEAGAKFADTTLKGFIGRAKAFGQDAGVTLVDKVTAPLTRMGSAALDKMIKFLASPEGTATIDAIAQGLGKAVEFGGELASIFGESFSETWKVLGKAVEPVLGLFAGSDGSTAIEVMKDMAKYLGQAAAVAVGAAGAFAVLATGVSGAIAYVSNAVRTGLFAAVEWVGKGIGDMILWWDNLSAKIDAMGPTLADKALGIGKAIVGGLIAGIKAMGGAAIDAITGLLGKVVGSSEKELKIDSPSKVYEEMGMWSAVGYERGWERNVRPLDFGPTMSSLDLGSNSPMATTATAAGGNVIHYTQHIEVHGGRGDADDLAQLVAVRSRRDLEAFFRQLDME